MRAQPAQPAQSDQQCNTESVQSTRAKPPMPLVAQAQQQSVGEGAAIATNSSTKPASSSFFQLLAPQPTPKPHLSPPPEPLSPDVGHPKSRPASQPLGWGGVPQHCLLGLQLILVCCSWRRLAAKLRESQHYHQPATFLPRSTSSASQCARKAPPSLPQAGPATVRGSGGGGGSCSCTVAAPCSSPP
eukprot:COSAG01_NODE_8025_length_2950_cov_1.257454_4_plen_187_part_00